MDRKAKDYFLDGNHDSKARHQDRGKPQEEYDQEQDDQGMSDGDDDDNELDGDEDNTGDREYYDPEEEERRRLLQGQETADTRRLAASDADAGQRQIQRLLASDASGSAC